MCLNGVGGTILLLQNNKWIVSELKDGNCLGLIKQAHTTSLIIGLQMIKASSLTISNLGFY